MDPASLPLRDVHLPPSPPWWPPAPGWWWLAAALLLLACGWAGWHLWRAACRRRWLRWFDADTSHGTLPEQLAAMSVLLRRAARHRRPGSELLQGDEWLRFLDGARGQAFSAGAGSLLLDGGFRLQLDPSAFAAARAVARARFLELMEGR
ncbi:DUF4381 family protein [Pseudoxanthomonas koreensis]|uniref:DUF4381 family protein n=1 Tax=Pseudoxanthomonas koreensis TaxID=266061 RepID=UPI0013911F54|nr:DUF4381 family protein [Pseudoxanthomonas koreensis]KAF1691975.1 hypothetical protein CSC64_07755 [Pseudoxanthomonas koreensis]